MAERGCLLVPTLAAMRDVLRWAEEGASPRGSAARSSTSVSRSASAVRIARDYGVQLAAGTDYIKREQHGGTSRSSR